MSRKVSGGRVRDFILRNFHDHMGEIADVAAKALRAPQGPRAGPTCSRLVREKKAREAIGTSRGKPIYRVKGEETRLILPLRRAQPGRRGLARQDPARSSRGLTENVQRICYYGLHGDIQ